FMRNRMLDDDRAKEVIKSLTRPMLKDDYLKSGVDDQGKLPEQWRQRFQTLQPDLKTALERKDELAKEIAHQVFLAQQAISKELPEKDRDYGRALSLLSTVEKLVKEAVAPKSKPEVGKQQ